ncbi:M20/M25/M40 family metallo-hydrolase [Silvibacterium acidisoli]|uniref:M20/M25/M40 family metallo-hydrolase n=1 Tax=Acidobacteriaceae bacterium ZG23-2 TaxID=2883246 RepID=UPI00406CE94C
MASTLPASAFSRVSQIAADRRVHQAFQWLHINQQQILRWQAELVAVPAPPFGERVRAEWLAERFRGLNLDEVYLDPIGNVIAIRRAAQPSESCLLLSAHIDTVFPADTPIEPKLNGTRLEAPGACDNGAGVVCLLALAAALEQTETRLNCDLIFAGNVGEEGEGDLRGVRYIYEHAEWRDRVAAHIVLDGAGHEVAVTDALGSLRYMVTITGPGGHSWTDAGRPNPIVTLSRAVARLGEIELPSSPRTTFNVGTIEGGTSVNAIPEQASARFDLRSTDAEELIRLEVELYRAVEDAVMDTNRSQPQSRRGQNALAFTIEKIGSRPVGRLSPQSALYETLSAVDRHLNIHTQPRVASTDANIPLSLGIPAVSVGAGGDGGGIHTRGEWYDAHRRELGLRRILLLLLSVRDQAQVPAV